MLADLQTMLEVTLRSGCKMPRIQLGTYRTRRADVEVSVSAALEVGYRAIDTAAVYRNHKDIADSLNKHLSALNLERKDIFLTSKLAPKDHGAEGCKAGILKALQELNTDYLDLYLIHWPGVQKLDVDDPKNSILRLESWKVMEEFHKRGQLRSIGVSNYTVSHLEELLEHCDIVPHVNQVEIHPMYPQEELVNFCTEHDIHVQAYSSLGQAGLSSPLFSSKPVLEIAQRLNKSVAQILLRWGLQRGYTVLPKSTNPQHIEENLRLEFSISDLDMEQLNNLHTDNKQKFAWDPVTTD